MQFSSRLDRFGAEVFSALNARRVALEEQGRTIYNLSVGTPDFAPYPHVVEALTEAAQDPRMWKYSLRDLPELKQAVCDYYARRFGVEGITPKMCIRDRSMIPPVIWRVPYVHYGPFHAHRARCCGYRRRV